MMLTMPQLIDIEKAECMMQADYDRELGKVRSLDVAKARGDLRDDRREERLAGMREPRHRLGELVVEG